MEMSGGFSVEKQMQELLNDSSLESKKLPWSTIHRIPTSMHDPNAYAPELVSIGPFHYSDKALAPLLKHKVRFFVSLSKRLYGSSAVDNDLKKAADKMVDKVRECYSERFDMISDSDFSWMIALDACFVLELFRHYHHHRRHRHNSSGVITKGKVVDEDVDPIFRGQWFVATLRMDLIKMENQLPYFVLQQFYDLTRTPSSSSSSVDEEEEQPTSLAEYAANFFAPLVPSAANSIHAAAGHFQSSHAHLLAFFHSIFNPRNNNAASASTSTSISISEGDQSVPDIITVGNVSELIKNYGVKFRKGNGGLLDILFTKGNMLEIPDLKIDKHTILLFRNLLAYEACDTRVPSYFTTYIAFFSQLLSSPTDVSRLHDRGILTHSLVGDEQLVTEVANLFTEVAFAYNDGPENNYLSLQLRKLDHFKNRLMNKWIYTLRNDYFDEPGKFITYVFTFLGIYLAVIQTIYTILSYTREKH